MPYNITDMDELDILREQMAIMKKNLDSQQIINKQLMRTVMGQRASWLNRLVTVEIVLLPLFFLIFVASCLLFKISIWYAIIFLVLGAIDTALDWHTLRISPKTIATSSLVEIKKVLINQKKKRFWQTAISLPLALVWLVAYIYAIATGNDMQNPEPVNMGGLIGGLIGGIIGTILVIVIYRKAQKTNDAIIKELEDTEDADA